MPDYSALDKFLHRLALGTRAVADMSHDMERSSYLKDAPGDGGRHVYVTGLARAGTTVLMREIYATGQFGSLTYAEMPFVLAPNLWRRYFGKKNAGAKSERAHGDGIAVDVDSPEALEEVFWRLKTGDAYLRADSLVPYDPDPETLDAYSDYVRLILRHTARDRYLCKNNNNILRLGALAARYPGSVFLVPIRSPGQHALSLLRQHQRFRDTDTFTANYMRWLAHHEFGADQRPFVFGERPQGDPDHLDYWLSMWIGAYTHLRRTADMRDNVLFVPFEALTQEPDIWPAIASRIGIEDAEATELKQMEDRDPGPHSDVLAKRARALYADIVSAARAQIG